MITPTLEQRLACRSRPMGRPVMRQRWSRLLFLHWRVDPAVLQARLPRGLYLDLHEGDAWLGIVPFFMDRVRPVLAPPVPWLSWFLELNVRIYVHDEAGVPGVWFISLDCNQPLAVEIARRTFHLPYEHAAMRSRIEGDRTYYECRRKSVEVTAVYDYAPSEPCREAEPGSLEFFLAERYLLYSSAPGGRIFAGRVHHTPYRLAPAECREWSAEPARWGHIPLSGDPPESALWAAPVDVSIFRLQEAVR